MLEIKLTISGLDPLVESLNKLAGALDASAATQLGAMGTIERVGEMLTISPDAAKPVNEKAAEEAPVNHIGDPEPVKSLAQVAEKDRYFYHSKSDSYWMLKKGEVIPIQDVEQCSEVTKEEYDKWMAPEEEAPVAAEPISAGDLFAKCQALIQGKKMQVQEFREMLQEFGVIALPDLTEDQRAAFNAKLPKEV